MIDFVHAREAWLKVQQSKETSTPDGKALGLVAQRHIQDIDQAAVEEKQLVDKLITAQNSGEIYAPKNEPQLSATLALRFEAIGDWGLARASWLNIIPKDTRKEADQMRPWTFLAKRKSSEMTSKLTAPGAEKDEMKARLAALDAKLSEVTGLAKERPVPAVSMCKDVLDLYAQNKDPEVNKKLAQFEKLMTTLPQGEKG